MIATYFLLFFQGDAAVVPAQALTTVFSASADSRTPDYGASGNYRSPGSHPMTDRKLPPA